MPSYQNNRLAPPIFAQVSATTLAVCYNRYADTEFFIPSCKLLWRKMRDLKGLTFFGIHLQTVIN